MNDLTKQQLILLALLVSFVTSLATGIVTVSLMDQAPQGVTRTITQVIEKTIQAAAPQDATVTKAAPTEAEQTTSAVGTVSLGIVRIKGHGRTDIAGMGLVISKKGVILANKATVAPLSDYDAVLQDGTAIPMTIIQSQIQGDIVFLAPAVPNSIEFSPVDFVSPELGQLVYSLSGTSSPELGQGLVTKVPDDSGYDLIKTSLPASDILPGSALFNIKGQVLGIRVSESSEKEAEYYLVKSLTGVIPIIK